MSCTTTNCYYTYVGVPDMVPNVAIVANSIMFNGEYVTLSLSWEEPYDNRDLIINYIISCSSIRCPSNFPAETTDIATTNYAITDLSPNTNYTFSVAAINSVGKGNAGTVNVTTPGKITL